MVGLLSIFAASHAVADVVLSPCNGGGRIVNSGTLSLSDCIVSGNSTIDAGGGVNNTGTMTLTRVVVTGNHSDLGGGGIYNGGTMTLVDVIVMGNGAGEVGGGIHNDGGTLYMSNTTVSGNTAGTGGGGIANTFGLVIGTAIAVAGNATTTGNGGGVYNHAASTCFAEGAPDFGPCFDNPTGGKSLISGNTASAGHGGGVANDGGSVSLADSTIDGNHAQIASSVGGGGGGIWNLGATTQLLRVTVSNNTAEGNGGGVFNDGGSVCCSATGDRYATNLTISGNSAAGAGGASFAVNGATTSLRSTTIADNSGAAGAGAVNADATSAVELKDTLLARNGSANCTGTITSRGNNLDTGVTCAFASAGDLSNVDDANVGLGALAANGGPAQGSDGFSAAMKTQALASTSPAADAGSATCPAADERGVARPKDGNGDSTAGCDIGAFELQVPPPPIIDTKPPNPSNSTHPTFTFHDTVDGVMFDCSIDGVLALANCASPFVYGGPLGEGLHTFAVTASKDDGTSSPTTYRWTVDTTPPSPTIDSRPADPTNSTTATFTFHSNEAGSTFECSLDAAPFAACSSGQTYGSLASGLSVFRVRATDAAGNTGETFASWIIDTTPPDTTVVNAPPARTNATTATFTFYSEFGATFQCSLDSGSFASCGSCSVVGVDSVCVQAYSSLGNGPHTFQVRAIDIAGNTDPTPATYTWAVDLIPPEMTIVHGPSDPTNSSTAEFLFSSEPGATYLCKLDIGSFFPCNNVQAFYGLFQGPHTLQVKAVDSVGNVNPTPVLYNWTIDQTAPNTTIDSWPPNPSNASTASFTFHSDEAGSTFQCSLDDAPFVPCTSGQTYNALGSGPHSFRVRAFDAAGNGDLTPAAYDWSIIATTTSYDHLASIGTSLAQYASSPKVKKAIDSIKKALAPKYWADGNFLTKDGQAVFNFAHDAINNLLGVTSPSDVASAAQSAIASLITVCRGVAAAAIQYAIDHAGDSKEIGAAQKEMTAAQSDLAKGHPDSAMTHYGNAWLHAWKAVN